MMDIAENKGRATIHYNHQCIGADLENGIVQLKDLKNNREFEDSADLVFAADGAFSSEI